MKNKTPNYKARRAGVTAIGAGIGAAAGAYLAHKQGATMSGDFWRPTSLEDISGMSALGAMGTRMAMSSMAEKGRNLGRQFKK